MTERSERKISLETIKDVTRRLGYEPDEVTDITISPVEMFVGIYTSDGRVEYSHAIDRAES